MRLLEVINNTWGNLQITKDKSVRRLSRSPNWFVLCDLQIFSGSVHHLSSNRMHHLLFYYPGQKNCFSRDIYITRYCKSRIFRMHVIFVYFVRGGFRTKIKCMRKVQSKSENPQRSATVRKFHAYERSKSPGYENWVRTKYSGFTVDIYRYIVRSCESCDVMLDYERDLRCKTKLHSTFPALIVLVMKPDLAYHMIEQCTCTAWISHCNDFFFGQGSIFNSFGY